MTDEEKEEAADELKEELEYLEDDKGEIQGIIFFTDGNWNSKVKEKFFQSAGEYECKVEGNSFTLVMGAEDKIILGAKCEMILGAECKLVLPLCVDVFAGIKIEATLAALFEMSMTAKFEKHTGPTYEWEGLKHLELVPSITSVAESVDHIRDRQDEIVNELTEIIVESNHTIARHTAEIGQANHTIGQLQADVLNINGTIGNMQANITNLSMVVATNFMLTAATMIGLNAVGNMMLQIANQPRVVMNMALVQINNALIVLA